MNSEIRIKQLEERVAYLETIAQSSAHEILTAYIHDVAQGTVYLAPKYTIEIAPCWFLLTLKSNVRKRLVWH